MKRIIDISVGLEAGMLVFPTNPGFVSVKTKSISEGGTSNVSEIRIGSHTGTHVDPPSHFIEGGATADALPLDVLIGEAVVVDLTSVSTMIEPRDLESIGLPADVARLLVRTRNSSLWGRATFPESYISFSADAAAWMVERGIRLVGVDFLSIEERGAPGSPTHNCLLGAGVVIVEGLDLSGVRPGVYDLVCLPLKVVGGDGAPARAVLIQR